MSASETSYFSNGNISVTRTLVRVGAKSYPINGIGSVFIKRGGPTFAIIILLLTGVLAWGCFATDSPFGGLFFSVVAVFALIAAFRPTHHLIFHTAAGETQAVRSRDTHLLSQVQSAVEAAVMERG